MRRSDQEFRAEVFRRSEECQKRSIRTRTRLLTGGVSFIACALLFTAGTITMMRSDSNKSFTKDYESAEIAFDGSCQQEVGSGIVSIKVYTSDEAVSRYMDDETVDQLADVILSAAEEQNNGPENQNKSEYTTTDREKPQTYHMIVTDTLGNVAEYVLTEDDMLFRDGVLIAAEAQDIETIRELICEALSD